MGAIKRTEADKAFSLCVRARAGFRCERCGNHYDPTNAALHASHHHRRGQWGVRFDPDNAEALCYGCHSHYGGTQERMDEVLTPAQREILRDKKEDIALAKQYRKTKGRGAIAKHFRDEFSRIMEERAAGNAGRIEFEAWL